MEENEKVKPVKPVVIFTNFWDANKIIGQKSVFLELIGQKFTLNKYDKLSIHSIALSHPPLEKLPHLKDITKIDFFCPTYDLLHRYKEDNDWGAYVKDYKDILRSRKEKIKYWVDSLKSDTAYILCCWENTSLKSKCHRQLVCDALNSSAYTKDKVLTVYRNGNEK